MMKSARTPPLLVDPSLLQAAAEVLREDESLSGFVEEAVRLQIRRRQEHTAFIARGLASRDRAKAAGDYVSSGDMLRGLEQRLASAKKSRTQPL